MSGGWDGINLKAKFFICLLYVCMYIFSVFMCQCYVIMCCVSFVSR